MLSEIAFTACITLILFHQYRKLKYLNAISFTQPVDISEQTESCCIRKSD